MRSSQKKLAALLALAVAATAWLGAWSFVTLWMWTTGARVANGGSTAAFAGKPAVLVSVFGAPTRAISQQAGLYHVLVIFPADSVSTVVSGITSGDVVARTHDEWNAWSRFEVGGGPQAWRRSLDSDYNALLNRVTIHGRAYSLARGNLFVARFGDGDHVEVVQLPRRVHERAAASVVKVYQASLPGDAVVRGLKRYPKQPCPRRAPSAAPTSEA